MTMCLVGAGGWAYFQIPGLKSLEAYSKAFDFVEVNSTFYEIPNLGFVETWRRRVPCDFEFAVRCHRNVTHKHMLEPVDEVFETFSAIKTICRILDSRFLVLETPSTLIFDKKKIRSVRAFFDSVDLKGIKVVLEVRRLEGEPVPASLISLMKDQSILQCVDISKEMPVMESDTVYTRVFGKRQHNIYQFTDEEIMEINKRMFYTDPKITVVSYHNVKMYKDAARHKIYRKTGKFPSVTGAVGKQSIRKVIMEDANFPVRKMELLRDQGWKVIDLTENKRVHALTLLRNLPDKRYEGIEEVLAELQIT